LGTFDTIAKKQSTSTLSLNAHLPPSDDRTGSTSNNDFSVKRNIRQEQNHGNPLIMKIMVKTKVERKNPTTPKSC